MFSPPLNKGMGQTNCPQHLPLKGANRRTSFGLGRETPADVSDPPALRLLQRAADIPHEASAVWYFLEPKGGISGKGPKKWHELSKGKGEDKHHHSRVCNCTHRKGTLLEAESRRTKPLTGLRPFLIDRTSSNWDLLNSAMSSEAELPVALFTCE